MSIDYAPLLFNGLIEGITPVLKLLLAPIILWVFIPGIITQVLFQSRQAYALGAFVGFVALFTFGPYSNSI
jgi:hypothetical protein